MAKSLTKKRSVYMRTKLLEQLTGVANRMQRSVNWCIVDAIKRWLDGDKGQDPASD